MKKNSRFLPSIPAESYSVAVYARNLVSQEGVIKDGVFSHIIKNVSFELKKADVLALLGEDYVQTRIVTEIVASLRNYYAGQCVLAERGMMRDKRHILPHLFFFDHNSMLFENMTVLEYCAFVLNRKSKDYAVTQKDTLLTLTDCGLDYISLTPIHLLTDAEKCLVQLFTAYLSKSNIVVAELSRVSFLPNEINAFSKITKLITQQQCSLLFATMQIELVYACSRRYIEIKDGVSSLPKRSANLSFIHNYKKLKTELNALIEKSRQSNTAKNDIMISKIMQDLAAIDETVAALTKDDLAGESDNNPQGQDQ
jgi:ABC-type ATPase involved in cell division